MNEPEVEVINTVVNVMNVNSCNIDVFRNGCEFLSSLAIAYRTPKILYT